MLTPTRSALLVLLVAIATIAGAWVFEWFGYAPCDLCLKQRWAYYGGIPLAALATLAAWRGPAAMVRPLLVLVGVVFLGSAVFGVYHAGVEWGAWPGPAGCTGAVPAASGAMPNFMQELNNVRIVRCDEVALRIFGISLAGWNAIISLAMAAIALRVGLASKN